MKLDLPGNLRNTQFAHAKVLLPMIEAVVWFGVVKNLVELFA